MEKMCYCIIRAVQQYSDTDEHHQGGMDMAWQFRNDIPIYTQLIAQIQQRIVSGALLPGERLPSVRDLAAEGLTMLVVTHEMAFARDVSNHVVFMRDGVIWEEGTPQQIFENPQKAETQEFLSRFRAH